MLEGQESRVCDHVIRRQIQELVDSPREHYWLDRLFELACWPVLFVCGANHVDTFTAKAKARGRTVSVLHHDWEPGGRMTPSSLLKNGRVWSLRAQTKGWRDC